MSKVLLISDAKSKVVTITRKVKIKYEYVNPITDKSESLTKCFTIKDVNGVKKCDYLLYLGMTLFDTWRQAIHKKHGTHWSICNVDPNAKYIGSPYRGYWDKYLTEEEAKEKHLWALDLVAKMEKTANQIRDGILKKLGLHKDFGVYPIKAGTGYQPAYVKVCEPFDLSAKSPPKVMPKERNLVMIEEISGNSL